MPITSLAVTNQLKRVTPGGNVNYIVTFSQAVTYDFSIPFWKAKYDPLSPPSAAFPSPNDSWTDGADPGEAGINSFTGSVSTMGWDNGTYIINCQDSPTDPIYSDQVYVGPIGFRDNIVYIVEIDGVPSTVSANQTIKPTVKVTAAGNQPDVAVIVTARSANGTGSGNMSNEVPVKVNGPAVPIAVKIPRYSSGTMVAVGAGLKGVPIEHYKPGVALTKEL